MARTIKVYGPTGMTSPQVELFTDADASVEAIALTEATNAKGVYRGTLTAAAGTYDAVVTDGATHKGTFGYVRVMGDDPEAAVVGDAHGIPDGIKLGKSVQELNQAGDTHNVTRTEV